MLPPMTKSLPQLYLLVMPGSGLSWSVWVLIGLTPPSECFQNVQVPDYPERRRIAADVDSTGMIVERMWQVVLVSGLGHQRMGELALPMMTIVFADNYMTAIAEAVIEARERAIGQPEFVLQMNRHFLHVLDLTRPTGLPEGQAEPVTLHVYLSGTPEQQELQRQQQQIVSVTMQREVMQPGIHHPSVPT